MSEQAQHAALTDRHRFCDLLAEARRLGVRGAWEGSAFRDHPCGVIRDGLIFTNDWHVDDFCSIRAMKAPAEPIPGWCQDSLAYRSPHPLPPSGTVEVWRNGRWLLDGPWQEKASKIIDDIQREVCDLKQAEADAIRAKEDAAAMRRASELAALKVAHGASA